MKQKGLGDASDRIINTGSSIEEVSSDDARVSKNSKAASGIYYGELSCFHGNDYGNE